MADTLHFTCYKYGAHDLQRIGVWARDPSLHEAGLELAHEPAREPDSTTSSHAGREEVDDADEDIGMESSRTSSTGGQGYWVIYIHGGAWRDPTRTFNDFVPAINRLCNRTSKPEITAFASIDYRLSAHPSHPQDPSSTPKTSLRDARHPDHLHDVCAAIVFLNRRFGFGSRYIIVGHSAGATLAFQAVTRVLDSKARALDGQVSGHRQHEDSGSEPESEPDSEPESELESEADAEAGHNKTKTPAGVTTTDGGDEAPDEMDEADATAHAVAEGGDGEWEDDPDWEDVDEPRDQAQTEVNGVTLAGLPNYWQELIRKHVPSWNGGAEAGSHVQNKQIPPVKIYPTEEKEDHFTLPQAVVGVAGIYEFRRLNERYGRGYTEFLAAAFGEDEAEWDKAAPALYSGCFTDWAARRLCVLGWSTQDPLVDELEIIGMAKRLESSVPYFADKRPCGDHDFAWKDGEPVARLVEEALDRMR